MVAARQPVPATGADTAAVPDVSLALFRLLITGRWVVLVTILLTITLGQRFPVDRTGVITTGVAIAVYNISQWLLLRTGWIQAYPPALLIGVDLILVTLLDWFSGGVRSPFLGLYYLWIVTAAAFRDVRGSIMTAAAITVLELIMASVSPVTPFRRFRLDYVISSVPYLFLVALASGYLVRRLREQWERRQAAEAEVARLATERASIDHEMDIARQVQNTFLHTRPPHVPGLAVGVHTQQMYGIGGDLLDFVPIPGGIVIAAADVSGHSLGAALLAARLSHILEEVGLSIPLEQVPEAWNRAIFESTPAEVFVSAAFCELRYTDGYLRYTIAGHPPPLLWRQASGAVEYLSCAGRILGALEETDYKICETRMEPGDLLLLYTDGATEARDAQGEMLGMEGLAGLLAQRAALPPQEIVDRLAADIAADHRIRDDISLTAVVRTTAATDHHAPSV